VQQNPALLGVLAQDGDDIVGDLQETAAHVKPLVGAAACDAQLTFTQQDKHGRVTLQHTELTIPRRRHDLIGLALEHRLFRAYD
jgi:hypothetical protein